MKTKRIFLMACISLIFVMPAIGQVPQKGIQIQKLEGHSSAIEAVSVSNSGKWALSAEAATRDISLWEFPKGPKIRVFEGPKGRVRFEALAISPDDKTIVAAFEATLYEWSIDSPKKPKVTKLTEEKGEAIGSIAFSNDGKLFVVSVLDYILIRDRSSGDVQRKIILPKDKSDYRLSFSANSNFLVGALRGDSDIKVWSVVPDREDPGITLKGHRFDVSGVHFVNEDTHIVSAGWDNTIRFWDAKDGALVKLYEAEDIVSGISYCPKKNLLAAGVLGEGVVLFDTKQFRVISRLLDKRSVSAVAISPDGNRLLVGYGDILPSRENQGVLEIIELK